MKNLKIITILIFALTTVISCSKNDDETIPTFEELLVENSPWKFSGLELSNVIDNENGEFDIDEFEEDVRQANDNTFYIFNADETCELIDNNESRTLNWVILENNQLKLSDGEWENTFINLIVTNTKLEFSIENMLVNKNVKAHVKYLLSKKSN